MCLNEEVNFMRIIAVDLGKARTGLAICDEGEKLASPIGVITEYHQEKLLEKIWQVAKEHGAQMFVVGLPRNMDGTEGESAQNARAFSKELARISNLPVELSDERGTTITAHNYLNHTNTRGKRRKEVIDTVAAVIILEDFLRRRTLSQ